MKKIILLIPIMIISVYSFSQSRTEYIQMGIYWSERKEYQRAINIYDEAISKFGKDSELLVLRGEEKTKLCLSTYLKNIHVPSSESNFCTSALADFSEALTIIDTFCYVYHSRGYLYLNIQNYEKALKDYNNFIGCAITNEDKVKGLVNRGTCYLRLGKLKMAFSDFDKALAINPSDFGIYTNIAFIFSEKGDYNNAEKYLIKAWEIDSTQVIVLNNLGFLRIQQNNFNSALRIYEEIYRTNKTDPFVLNNLGFVQCKLGDIEKGLENINESLLIYPDNSYAYKNRGLIYLDINESEKACSDFQRAISLGYTLTYGDEVKNLIKKHCK